jgi:hypothetical protein
MIWEQIVALFTPKNATKEVRDADARVNSPYCPRCYKSTVDMAEGYATYEDWHGQRDRIMVVRCDGCGKISRWIDTGFMGVRGVYSGFKEYQTKEAYREG